MSRISAVSALVLAVVLAFGTLVWLVGSSNPFTPAGYVGYLTKGALFAQSRYIGTQRGSRTASRTRWRSSAVS